MVPGRMNNQQNTLPGKEERKDQLRVTKSQVTQGNNNDDINTYNLDAGMLSGNIGISPDRCTNRFKRQSS